LIPKSNPSFAARQTVVTSTANLLDSKQKGHCIAPWIKNMQQTLVHIFAKCWPIFRVLLLTDFADNSMQFVKD